MSLFTLSVSLVSADDGHTDSDGINFLLLVIRYNFTETEHQRSSHTKKFRFFPKYFSFQLFSKNQMTVP